MIAVLIIGVFVVTGCGAECILDNINASAKLSVIGDGYHRILSTNIDLISRVRLVNCLVTLEYSIPPEAYLDFDSLHLSSAGSSLIAWSSANRFDVERQRLRKPSPFRVCFEKPIMNSFVFSETIQFPIHLYYSAPVDWKSSNGYKRVRISPPEILLRCDSSTSDFVRSCPNAGQTKSSVCRCYDKIDQSPSTCVYLRVRSLPIADIQSASVSVDVPVGYINHRLVIGSITVVVVATACLFICYVTSSGVSLAQDGKKKVD